VVDHDADMLSPLEVVGDKDPEVAEGGDGGDIVCVVVVPVLGTPDLVSGEVWLVRL